MLWIDFFFLNPSRIINALCVCSTRPVECQSPTWTILRPSQLWPERSSSHHQPTHQPFRGPSSTRLACLPHLQVYKKTKKEKKITTKKKKRTVIPYHSHHQGTQILPVLKGEQKTKKRRKRTSCYTEVLYLGTWKQGCFHTFFFFFSEIMHTSLIFFVLLEFMHFCNSFEVCLSPPSPPKLLCFLFSWLQLSIMGSSLQKTFYWSPPPPVIHTDVVALHYIRNVY